MHEKVINEVDLNEIPVAALRPKTITRLSCMLNRTKVLPSPECLPRDYRGLAHLMEVSTLDGWLGENPTEKLLTKCIPEKELRLSIKTLQTYFEKMDRYDVLDDTKEMFLDDAIEYENKKHSLVPTNLTNQFSNKEQNILTLDDIIRSRNGDGYQMYDAFILYVDADKEFAECIITKMEIDYNLKICDKDRDLVAGLTFEHNAIMKLISERCSRLLVILSDEFVRSDRHTFFVKYAQALNYELGVGNRKVIPCIYKPCDLPFEYRTYVSLDYQRISMIFNFWEKLYSSILITSPNSLPVQHKTSEKVIIKELPAEIENNQLENTCCVEDEKNQIQKQKVMQPNFFKENVKENTKKSPEKNHACSIVKKVRVLFTGTKMKNNKSRNQKIACAI